MKFTHYPQSPHHPPSVDRSKSIKKSQSIFLSALVAATLLLPAQLRATDAPPHHISAANLNVVENDTGNTANSVTVNATLSINDMRVRPGSNRGDYNLQIGDSVTNNSTGGVLMVAISENGRDNGELADEQKQYAAPAFDGGPSGLWASINDLSSDRAEMNINSAVAYFRTNDWVCGWFRNTNAANGGSNTLYTGSPGITVGNSTVTSVGAYNFKWVKGGEFRVSLFNQGIDCRTNPGILLVNHAKNEGNYASSRTNTDGTWEVYVKDNFGNNTSLEQDPVAFVFVPRTNTFVVSGRFGLDATGSNTVVLSYSGNSPAFSITNFETGRYRLTIPGGSPDAGVLIVSSEGGVLSNFDNTVSYQPDGNGWIIEARDVGTYPPLLESTTNEPVASFIYIPAATAGVAISPTNTLITAEFGLSATFNVQLDLAPTNDVTINLSSSNPSEGIVSPTSITFNATNWNVPQTITVTGQDDAVADGPVAYSIVLAPIVSDDLRYNGLDPADVSVINVDDEQPGITVTPIGGLTTSESGSSATFAVFLNKQPSADVTFALASDTPSEGTNSPTSLTFNTANWSTPQIVTVSGVPDFRKDGNKAYKIVTSPATSADANYNGINPADVSLVNIDIDNPAIRYNAVNPMSVIEGNTTNYTVVLATRPDSNIVVTVNTSDATIATVSPSTLTFTPVNWNTPQVVTLIAGDNLIPDGNINFNVTNTVSSTDPLYADFAGAKVLPAIRLDNETSMHLTPGDSLYGLRMPAIGIDGMATMEDADATNYNNGALTVTLVTNGLPVDILAVRNDGTNDGQIAVSGTTVTYGTNVIGTVSGGTNNLPLTISLNINSTLPAVQQLIRSVTFFTPATNASLATRVVTFTLDDGLGGVVSGAKNVRVGALRLTQYQEGGDYGYGIYHGAFDTALTESKPGTPLTPGSDLLIDWPDGGTPNESQVLMQFTDFVGTNYWQVPSNAIIVSAELLIDVNNTGDGGKLFRMLMPWDTNAVWVTFGDGILQDDFTARSQYESQVGVEDGSGATGVGVVSIGVTPDVQAWVNGDTNYGWVIEGWPLQTDGTGFTSSENTNVPARPRLRVLWLDQGVSMASFREGENGYTNAFDTNLRQASPTVNYATEVTIWSDANDPGSTNATECLLRFDNIIGPGTNQVPPGSLIHAAVLEMPSIASDSMGDGGLFYAMLQPWVDTSVTWSTYGPTGIQPDGMVAATTPTVVAGNTNLDPDVQGTINTYEVTTDVQAWANGTRQNYGWVILPWPGGANGWGTRSDEFTSLVAGIDPNSQRPQLRVYYTAGAIAIPAAIKTLTISPSHVSVPFTGTPNFTYTIWRAPSVTGPWTQIGSTAVDGTGNGSYDDNAPLSGTAFYRIIY